MESFGFLEGRGLPPVVAGELLGAVEARREEKEVAKAKELAEGFGLAVGFGLTPYREAWDDMVWSCSNLI